MRELNDLFAALTHSRFRRSFHLQERDLAYLRDKGMATVLEHAADFVEKRLAPAVIANDGKQTPFRGHPVFVAQHATATCCRSCLFKWHWIPQGRALTAQEKSHVVAALERWLQHQADIANSQCGGR